MTPSPAAAPAAVPTYRGSCFCGDVRIAVTGAPVAMGYCHCDSCRRWSAAPVNAFTLWAPEAVEITQGAAGLGSYAATPKSHRKWCRRCGGHVFTEHPGMGLVDVYASVVPGLPFEPALHLNHAEAVVRTADGLPRFQDVPADMGGSGEVVAP